MKIATFNINNVNRRLPNLLEWLKTSAPVVVCLQELRREPVFMRQLGSCFADDGL
jgi:exodeoxyribonuclease III